MHFANTWLGGSGAQTYFKVMHQLTSDIITFHRICQTHGLFLERSCAQRLHQLILTIARSYHWLARKMLSLRIAGFSLKPKFHCLKHVAYQLRMEILSGKRFCLSPMAYNCEGNEDHVGRVCKLGRSVSTRTISRRVIERYFLKSKALIRRHQTSLKKKKEWKHEVGIVRWWEMIWSVWTKTLVNETGWNCCVQVWWQLLG